VLIEIVDRCCRIIRHIDTLGRYGGDEFVILLPETDLQLASEVANRIRTTINGSPIITEAGPVTISISIGITETTRETADLGLLLNKADQALYRSKRTGRNKVTVLP
jgi:diguanylate cyclase (GGDEF)-like protein